jgi:hypothetical protein
MIDDAAAATDQRPRKPGATKRREAPGTEETDLDFILARLEWAERTGSRRDGSKRTT